MPGRAPADFRDQIRGVTVSVLQQKAESDFLKIAGQLRTPLSSIASLIIMILGTSSFTLFSFFRIRTLDNWIIYTWARLLCAVNGVNVRVDGLEHLPAGGCILLFNHGSQFDIPIMYRAIRKHFRFGAKAELLKVPLLGMTLKSMGALPIHRGRRSDVLKLYAESVHRIHNGESFALAPEGTRQERPEIGEFKTGPFIFAIQAEAPLVPVVIKGALEVLPKGTVFINAGRWSREVAVKILPPVETKGLSPDDVDSLRQKVRVLMIEALEKIS